MFTVVTPNWFQVVFQLRGSVAPLILPRVLLFSGFSFLISLLNYFDLPVSLQFLENLTTNVVCNLVLGLLLVFRTNTAYERFWEGRKAWGTLVVNLRNLAREICVAIAPNEQPPSAEKIATLRLLPAFAIATKLHLRQDPNNQELESLVSSTALSQLNIVKHRPLELTLWLGTYLQQQYQLNQLDVNSFLDMKGMVNNLIEGLTNCERILRTPVPSAYSIYLRRLIFIYCVCLPFSLVDDLGWCTTVIVAPVSFILLGIEEIGNSIEDPFGNDINDLPLNEICHTILDNIEHVITFAKSDRSLPTSLPNVPAEPLQSTSIEKITTLTPNP
jgi:putative membrane protein